MGRIDPHQELDTSWRQRQFPAGSLIEFLAVRLILDGLADRFIRQQSRWTSPRAAKCVSEGNDHVRSPAIPDGVVATTLDPVTMEQLQSLQLQADAFTELDRRLVFQDAFERGLRHQMLDAIAIHSGNRLALEVVGQPQFQVVCCLDSCEESLRRHLEEVAPGCATFGAPGFFDIAMAYRGLGDSRYVPNCPPHVKPRHFVEEVPGYNSDGKQAPVWQASTVLAQLQWKKNADPHQSCGYSVDEMAEAVETLLRDIGLIDDFAPLVLMLGHGSSARIHPHSAAHECSFCGARSGGPNARVFATMANDPRVRRLLAGNGLSIPESTIFVGAEHQTCSDTVEYYDLSRLSEAHRRLQKETSHRIELALERNSHERCRRFETADMSMSTVTAAWHVVGRIDDAVELSSEYSFAGNAFCVVGRRSRTRGLFLDRRAFLASYDPTADDEDHTSLTRLLRIVLPACVSVNLEYYFSRTDPDVFGAGSESRHNVSAGLGVTSENNGDLRTGLPTEIVGFHDPARLLCIIESTPEAVLQALDQTPRISRLARNSWIHLATMNPHIAEIHEFRNGQFERYHPTQSSIPERASSRHCYQNWQDNLSIVSIT